MIEMTPEPADIVYEAACQCAFDVLGEEGWEIAPVAIPIHRLIGADIAGWDSNFPYVGAAFPIFSPSSVNSGELLGLVFVEKGQAIFEAADFSTGLGEAFLMAFGMADYASEATRRMRLIYGPVGLRFFWLEGDFDSYVSVEDPRVVHPSEIAELLVTEFSESDQ